MYGDDVGKVCPLAPEFKILGELAPRKGLCTSDRGFGFGFRVQGPHVKS